MVYWNKKAKQLLKSELVKRGISNADLVVLLAQNGVQETKSGIDSKISRGTFSAAFFIQCLLAIGCNKIELDIYDSPLSVAAESPVPYETQKKKNEG
ncbi:MAG: DUF6471 domain-containing protein [Bacteroidota bacterium]